jgi:hypothetical protein
MNEHLAKDAFRDSTPPQSGAITPAINVPETRDAFFGYNEEKSLQQVTCSDVYHLHELQRASPR